MAFPNGWGRKCELVIQSSQVTDDETNFTLVIKRINLPDEPFDADGTYPALNGGGDIRISSDSAGATQVSCEIDQFVTDNDPANGAATIWVKVPTVSSGTNTSIWIWYNKAGETQPAADAAYGSESVWNVNYSHVFHLKDLTTSTVLNSTGGPNGTKLSANNPIETEAKIAKGQDFSSDYIVTSDTGFNPAADFTVSTWVEGDTFAATPHVIFAQGDGDGTGRSILLVAADSYPGSFLGGSTSPALSTISTGTFYLLTVTYDHSANEVTIHINNDGGNTSTETGEPADGDLVIGNSKTYAQPFDGILDEFRLSNIVRSDGWIETEYNNQNSPATFIIEGTPTSPTISGTGSDGVEFSDAATTTTTINVSATDGITLSDTTTASGFYITTASDGIEFGDSSTNTLTISGDGTDGLIFSDLTTASSTATTSATDGLVLSDTTTVTVVTATISVIDGIELGETVSVASTATTSASDGLELSDTITEVVNATVELSDGIQLGEEISSANSIFNLSITDGIQFGDSIPTTEVIVNIGTYYMLDHWYDFNDGQWFDNNDDQWLPRDRYDPRYGDGFTSGEEATITMVIDVSNVDGIKFGDTSSVITQTSVSGIDGVLFTDGTTYSGLAIDKEATDSIEFSDTSTNIIQAVSSASDTIKFSDQTSNVLQITVSGTDGVEFSESTEIDIQMSISASDTVEFGDDITPLATALGIISDGINLGETISATAIVDIVAEDGFKLSDSDIGVIEVLASVADGLILSEMATHLDVKVLYTINTKDRSYYFVTKSKNYYI